MAYADKREGKLTGAWVGEAPKLHKKRRFKTKRDAEDYEAFCKLMGREPPTLTEDGIPLKADGEKTFAEVAKLCKDAGGPKGKWNAGRDKSVIQRVEYCVERIGHYGITRVTRALIKDQVLASLDRAKAPGKSSKLSNGTKNRYLTAASAVMTFAVNEDIIEHAPKMPWLGEKDRKKRDILLRGQEDVVLKLMREAGHEVDAICVEVLLETGLRSGELLRKLTPDQIAIEQVEDKDGTVVPLGVIVLRDGQTKNDEARLTTLPAELAKQIRALVAANAVPDGIQLLRHFKSACKRAGYTGNLVVHSLRHTRNTRLRKAGVEQKMRMELLGHTSDVVNDMYDHTDLQDHLEVAKKVREYAGKSPKSTVVAFPKAG